MSRNHRVNYLWFLLRVPAVSVIASRVMCHVSRADPEHLFFTAEYYRSEMPHKNRKYYCKKLIIYQKGDAKNQRQHLSLFLCDALISILVR
jgi:hypothetical protein